MASAVGSKSSIDHVDLSDLIGDSIYDEKTHELTIRQGSSLENSPNLIPGGKFYVHGIAKPISKVTYVSTQFFIDVINLRNKILIDRRIKKNDETIERGLANMKIAQKEKSEALKVRDKALAEVKALENKQQALMAKAQEETKQLEAIQAQRAASQARIEMLKKKQAEKNAAKAAEAKNSSPNGKTSSAQALPLHMSQPGLNVPHTPSLNATTTAKK